MDDLALARALHVLAVVIWIGGVAMVTMVILPSIRRGNLGPNRLQAFEAIERRFSWHAPIVILIVGLTGLYMIEPRGFVEPVSLRRILVDARNGRDMACVLGTTVRG